MDMDMDMDRSQCEWAPEGGGGLADMLGKWGRPLGLNLCPRSSGSVVVVASLSLLRNRWKRGMRTRMSMSGREGKGERRDGDRT